MTPSMTPPVERRDLSPGMSISRVVTGLWQLADMERDGRRVDLDRAAAAMRPYVDAGLTSGQTYTLRLQAIRVTDTGGFLVAQTDIASYTVP